MSIDYQKIFGYEITRNCFVFSQRIRVLYKHFFLSLRPHKLFKFLISVFLKEVYKLMIMERQDIFEGLLIFQKTCMIHKHFFLLLLKVVQNLVVINY